jgi:hypothetical protein
MLSMLVRQDARRYGFAHRHWTIRRLHQYLTRQEKKRINYAGVRKRVVLCGFRRRGTHALVPPTKAVEAAVREPDPNWHTHIKKIRLPAEILNLDMGWPVLNQLLVLQALKANGGEATTTELSSVLRKWLTPTALKAMLYPLRDKECVAAQAAVGGRKLYGNAVNRWRLLPHGRCMLELLSPWADMLYPRKGRRPHPLPARTLAVLCILEAFPKGLYPPQIAAAVCASMRLDEASRSAVELARLGLVESCRAPRGIFRFPFYVLIQRGRQLARVVRALCESRRTGGKLPASRIRTLRELRICSMTTAHSLPALQTLRCTGPEQRPVVRLFLKRELFEILQQLHAAGSELSVRALERMLPFAKPTLLRRLQNLKTLGLAHESFAGWRLSALGRAVAGVLVPVAWRLYRQPEQQMTDEHVRVLCTLSKVRKAATAQQLVLTRGSGLDFRLIYTRLGTLLAWNYVRRLSKARYRLAERGEGLMRTLRKLLSLERSYAVGG